ERRGLGTICNGLGQLAAYMGMVHSLRKEKGKQNTAGRGRYGWRRPGVTLSERLVSSSHIFPIKKSAESTKKASRASKQTATSTPSKRKQSMLDEQIFGNGSDNEDFVIKK
ncbi:MAG: hypothetical protein Q9214_004632, partial [Letrouitia sp. 1 TL-2023]